MGGPIICFRSLGPIAGFVRLQGQKLPNEPICNPTVVCMLQSIWKVSMGLPIDACPIKGMEDETCTISWPWTQVMTDHPLICRETIHNHEFSTQ